MPRHSPTRPSRRADGRPESSEGSSVASNSAGEEKSTTVAIRLRPLNDREKAGNQSRIWRCVPTHNSVTQTSADGNPLPDAKGSTFFTYDRIFDEDSSTKEVYEGVAREIVHSVVRGLNGTIFAYGQTSSGKTFTMQGGDNNQTPGIVQMAARDLFSLMDQTPERQFLMRVSYLEIYQEDIRDLLNPESSKLQVREDPRKGVYIEAHEEVVSGYGSVLQILNHGEKQRHVGCTEMNSRSSRSHTLFRLVVESQEHFTPGVHASEDEVDQAVLVATLNLVDLAGSESVRHTGATGQRQKEGGKINQSLLTLSRVIQTLSQGGTAHVNYRDSKLTRILQPSLSGNAGMAIICCATAAEGFLEETRSTLQFASRAKNIKTNAVVNEVLDDKAQLKRMSQELNELRRQQAEGGGGSALVETLQAEKAKQAAQIARLHNLIINCGGGAAAAVDRSVDVDELILDVSPRYRRTKRSRETWCPGESGIPLPLSLLDPNRRAVAIDEEGLDHLRKRASVDTPSSRASLSAGSPRTPLVSRGGVPTTPGVVSPARARAEQQITDMKERLAALQAERDEVAAKAEEVDVRAARVGELEVEVSSLKEELETASRVAAAGAAEAAEISDNAGEVAIIAAKLEETLKAKELLETELTEFGEYTDMKDQEMVEMKERMVIVEEGLRRKEAELAEIRAAEEQRERENACIDELQSRVLELEGAIKERDEKEDGMDTERDAEDKVDELAALKGALEESQKELAQHMTRADGAEEELGRLAQEVGSGKARLAEEHEAAERSAWEAAEAVATANKAVEAADAREREAEADLQGRLSSLEAERAALQEEKAVLQEEKAVLHDQGVELRELNDIAAGLLAEHEVKQTPTADADVQTEVDSDALVPREEAERAKQAVVDAQAEIAERDRTLVDHQARLEELEGSLAQAKAEQQALDIRNREEKEGADARLIEALTGQRRAEEALSAAYQSQLEMRCRLEDATQQTQEAEAARAEMAEAGSVSKMKDEEDIAELEKQVAEQESRLQTAREEEASASSLAEEANSAAAAAMEEAREAQRHLAEHTEASEVKDAAMSELATLVEGFEKENETVSQLEQQLKEAQEVNEKLVSEREGNEARVSELEHELEAAQARNEVLNANAEALSSAEIDARVEELSDEVAARVVEVLAARAELVAVEAAASTAEAKAVEEAARQEEASLEELSAARAALEASEAETTHLVDAAEVSAEQAAALQSELEAKTQENVSLTAAAESFESREEGSLDELSTARAALEECKAEIAHLIDVAEASVEKAAALQSEVEAKTEEIVTLTAAAASFESREEGSLDELSMARAALEECKAEIARFVDAAEISAEKTAALQSEVEAKTEEIVSLTAAAESFESREEGSLNELSTARAALEASTDEMAHLVDAAESSAEEAAALQAEVEAKTQEVASRTAAAESFESREEGSLDDLSTARAALEASTAEIARFVNAAKASAEEAAALQAEVEAKAQEIVTLTAAAESLESREEASLDDLSTARAALEASEAEIVRLVDAAEISAKEAVARQSEVEAKTEEIATLTAAAESFESREEGSLDELSTARAALEASTAEIALFVDAAEDSAEEAAALQAEVEAKAQEIVTLTAAAESLESSEEASLDDLSTACAALEASTAEIARLVDAAEISAKEAVALQSDVEAKTEEIVTLTAAAESFESREESSLDELSTARAALEASTAEIARFVDAAEASAEEAAALQAEVEAKTQEVSSRAAAAESLESREEASLDELSTARAALEASTAEIALFVDAAEVSAEQAAALQAEVEAKAQEIVTLTVAAESLESREEASLGDLSTARAALELAEAEILRVADAAQVSAEQAAALKSEVEAKTEEISSLTAVVESLESRVEAAETAAAKREAEGAARIAELEGQVVTATDQLEESLAAAETSASEASDLAEVAGLAETLAAELETARQDLAGHEREMAEVSAQSELDTSGMRAALDEMKESLAGKEEEVARLRDQAEEQVRKAHSAASASSAAVLENEVMIAEMKQRLEAKDAMENELTQALEDSENLTKEVLDLTDQLMEKETRLSAHGVTIAELQEQIEADTAELEALRMSTSSAVTAHTDGLEGQADNSVELRRLRVELDKKSSEVDTILKEAADVRAELKEIKAMLSKAEAGADAAGADEDSLRKRLSQLVCENGLLKGEKERYEALAASATSESRSSSSRAAVETDRLEREVEQLRERAGKVSGIAADGDRAKAALGIMESKLAEVRQERAELQDATQRSIDRCVEAENESENLRARLGEMEQRVDNSANRNAFAALETKVDELEEESRRAAASKADMEGEARQSANRAKRLLGEVEMMRSEYEIVSEEAMGLRGSLAATEAKLEEVMVQPAPAPVADRSEEMEAEIARLLKERVEMQSSHDEALRSLEAAVSRAQEEAERSEDESKAMEGQLRHRLEAQVAEAENLRHELSASREHLEQAGAAARASEQRTREGASSKKAAILEEMETLMEEKLCAENTAKGMAQELGQLKERVADAEERAFHDQSRIIHASQEQMAKLEEAIVAKDRSLTELQASLTTAREAERAATSATAELVQKAKAAATSDVASLTQQVEESKAVMEEKDARITHLERVRLTRDQVEKLQHMKDNARNTAADNIKLKERVADLDGAKKNLLEKLRQYGKRVHELEKEHSVVRAAVEDAGIAAADGRDLGDAVLELAERSAGIDASMMSSISGGEAAAVAAAVAGSERHYSELQEARSALRRQESERSGLQEQMRAGVVRFRELEAREASVRERLEQTESETKQKMKMQEKDHERQLRFLQEENVNLFQENTDVRTKADKLKAELEVTQEKMTTSQIARPPASATKKRACVDRTNVPIEAVPVGKPATAAVPPTSAAERRARSRALLESPAVEEEGGGDCNQS